MGDTGEVQDALLAIVREGPEWRIYLNPSKTILWWPSYDPLREVGFPTGIIQCRGRGVRSLGAPLSVSPGFVFPFIEDKAEEVVLIMDRLASLRDPHSELLLLRSCWGFFYVGACPSVFPAPALPGWCGGV